MSRQPWRWVAEREGRCAGCGRVIVKGSQTQKNPGSGWMHRECGQRYWHAKLDKQRKDVGMYPFEVIGRMRDVDPPSTGYYHYPATGEIVRGLKPDANDEGGK